MNPRGVLLSCLETKKYEQSMEGKKKVCSSYNYPKNLLVVLTDVNAFIDIVSIL